MTFAQGRNAPGREQATPPAGATALDESPDVDLAALVARMRAAAHEARDFILAHARALDDLTVEAKSPQDYVSEVDRGAERLLEQALLGAYPTARFVGEETAPTDEALARALADDTLTFVVDPLDGTTNFLHGYPEYAVSIAATSRGAPIAGVVVNAPSGETFVATIGGGASRDGEAIRVSRTADPPRALVGTGIPFKVAAHFAPYMPQLERVARQVAGIRRAGAAALDLCDVACGRLDAFWELQLQPWDMAAGALILREAGGVVTDLAGADARVASGPLVVGNPVMHRWLLAELAAAAR